MQIISRQNTQLIIDRLFQGKAIIVYGPRQVGKTTLCQQIVEACGRKAIWLNGDEPDVRSILVGAGSASLGRLVHGADILIIDEAQRIENIGLTIKILVDQFPKIQVIATGSSSLDLAGSIKEPLTGRKREFLLLPFTHAERSKHFGMLEERRQLETRLIFGSYPEVTLNPGQEISILKELAGSYLYKDILSWESLRHPERLDRLTKALALQLGSEVSYSELGQLTGMAPETVERYITLLEQAFLVFRLPAYARNVRNELKKSRKVYFYDLGIRNAILGQFSPITNRTDVGALWENHLIVERIKATQSPDSIIHRYFWRTAQQQEIDYLEERGDALFAYEFKWSSTAKARIPLTFSRAYPHAQTHIIHQGNFEHFVLGD